MDTAKKARTQAKKTFNRNGKDLENAMDSEMLPKTVQSMYAEVKEAWKIVQEKHDEYSSQFELTEGEGPEDPWTDELNTYYFALQIKVDKYLESCKGMERENEEKKMKEQAKEEEEKAKAEEKMMMDKEEQLKVENQKRLLADLLIRRDQEHIRFQKVSRLYWGTAWRD